MKHDRSTNENQLLLYILTFFKYFRMGIIPLLYYTFQYAGSPELSKTDHMMHGLCGVVANRINLPPMLRKHYGIGWVVWRAETVECDRLVLDMEGEKEYSVEMQALTSYACWKVLVG